MKNTNTDVYLGKNSPEPLVNIETVMAFLGNIPRKSIYKWVSEGTIPYYRPGRELRFRISEVEGWLKKYKSSGSQKA